MMGLLGLRSVHTELDLTVKMMERTIASVVHLCTLRTWSQFITGVTAIISVTSERTLVELLQEQLGTITDIVSNGVKVEQSGYEELADQLDAFNVSFGSLVDGWEYVRKGKLPTAVRRLLSLVAASCFIPKDMQKDHPFVYSMLFEELMTKEFSYTTLVDEVLATARLGLDVAAKCLRAGSWGPLCGTDTSVVQLEKDIAFIKAHMSSFTLGSFEKTTVQEGMPRKEAEFIIMVDQTLRTALSFHKSATLPQERLVMSRYVRELTEAKANMALRASRKHMRVEPFAVKLDGPTGMGKTTLIGKITADLLKIGGYPHTSPYIAFVESASKFMDTVNNATQGVIVDDALNTLVTVSKADENNIFIKLKNNCCTPVPKAAVEEKGATFLDVKVLVVSTNAQKLQAEATSVEPSAVLRRFAYHILVQVKPEFARGTPGVDLMMLDPSKMTKGLASDAHLFTLRVWKPYSRYNGPNANEKKDDGRFEVVAGPFGYSDMLEYLAPRVRSHFAQQVRIVDETMADTEAPLCEHGFTTALTCRYCQTGLAEEAGEGDFITKLLFPPIESPLTEEIPARVPQPQQQAPIHVVPPLTADATRGDWVAHKCRAARLWAYERARGLKDRYWDGDGEDCPEPSYTGAVRAVFLGRSSMEDFFIQNPSWFMTLVFGAVPCLISSITGVMFWVTGVSSGAIPAMLGTLLWTVHTVSLGTVRYVRSRVAGMPLSLVRQKLTQASMGRMRLLFAVFGSIIAVTLVVRRARRVEYDENGGCSSTPVVSPDAVTLAQPTPAGESVDDKPASAEPIQHLSKPDPVQREKHWERREIQTFPFQTGKLRTMTAEQLVAPIARQLFVVDVVYPSSTVSTNGLFVCSDWVLMPAHNFLRPDRTVCDIRELVFSATVEHRGPYFRAQFAPSQVLTLDGATLESTSIDMVLVQVNVGGTMRDLREMFADVPVVKQVPVVEYFREVSSKEILMDRYWAAPSDVTSKRYGWTYSGMEYERGSETFRGLCGAVLVSDTRYPQILGLHTMGSGRRGAACCILGRWIKSAFDRVGSSLLNWSPPVSAGATLFTVDGGSSTVVGPLKDNSVLRTIPVGAPVLPVGTLQDFAQSRGGTQLARSPVYELAEQCLGIGVRTRSLPH